MRLTHLVLPLLSSFFLVACDQSPETTSDQPADVEHAARESEAMPASDESPVADETSDEVCGSIRPLLDHLPVSTDVDAKPQVYRGCDLSGHQVKVVYATAGDQETELSYIVQSLNGRSPLLTSVVNVDGATEPQREFLRTAVTAVGDLLRVQFDTCKAYALEPIMSNGRNPQMTSIDGMAVCVMDSMDANQDVWCALGVQQDLMYRVELTGAEAAAIPTSVGAMAKLSALFSQFRVQ